MECVCVCVEHKWQQCSVESCQHKYMSSVEDSLPLQVLIFSNCPYTGYISWCRIEWCCVYSKLCLNFIGTVVSQIKTGLRTKT